MFGHVNRREHETIINGMIEWRLIEAIMRGRPRVRGEGEGDVVNSSGIFGRYQSVPQCFNL